MDFSASEWRQHQGRVLSRYSRAVAHMWQQSKATRLGLILGVGASIPIGFPSWDELVRRLAADSKVKGIGLHRSLDKSQQKPLPIISEVLFHRFRERNIDQVSEVAHSPVDVERIIAARWLELVHACLYEGIPDEPKELLKRDEVYEYFLDVVRESPLTINFNFDDSLQRLLLHTRTGTERAKGRGFETIADPRLQFGSAKGIIYHPNGHLPLNLLERTSERLVFNEGSFADQLIESMTGTYASLLHHLSKNTCLLIGLSLRDETLRHLLRQSSLLSPGHYHYYVEFVRDVPDDKQLEKLREQASAYFETYNLVTLFLDAAGIASLGQCLSMEEPDLRAIAEEYGARVSYTYYLTGVPGVGKTTTLGYFKSLRTYDEWLDERLPQMRRPYTELDDEETVEVDAWIREQLGLKNRRLLDRASEVGVSLVDRCVPDAITFTEADGWADKAASLLKAISPGKSIRRVHPGHVILMLGDPEEIKIRAATKNKETTPEYSDHLQDALKVVYPANPGITHLEVTDLSVGAVAKTVARVVHRHDYEECDLSERLKLVKNGQVVAPGDLPEK